MCIFLSHTVLKNEHNRAVKKHIEEEVYLNKENSYSKVLIGSEGLGSDIEVYILCALYSYFLKEQFKGTLSHVAEVGVN